MGVYIKIKGIEMPSKCIECRLMRRCGKDDLDYICQPARVYVEDLTNAYKPRPDYCPLVELPPHGRLIDADALIEKIDGIWDCNDMVFTPDDHCCNIPEDCKGCKWAQTKDCIRRMAENAPTIIEAEEGET